MASVTAFIRVSTKKATKANVRFRISDGRAIQLFYKSEIEISPNAWNPKKQEVKAGIIFTGREAFNDSITERKKSILRAYNDQVDKTALTSEILEVKIDQVLHPEKYKPEELAPITFFDRFKQYIEDAPVSAGRKKHLWTTYNKSKSFKPETTLENLDVQYLTDFQNFLLGDCNLSKNTVISELRRLRAFYGYAIKHGWTYNYPFKSFSIGAESFGDPIFITVEERDKLFNATIESDRLSRVRDLFVFQCLIGCRVGDLIKLKKSNIVNGCVEYIAAKTKDEKTRVARIPLTSKAKEILSRYNLENGDLLPYITDQKYNEYIKELFKLKGIEINRIVTIADPKTRQSKQISIAEVASSHMARRVFVGSLHRKGVKNEIIASMSGHTKDSKAFSRYYNIEQQDQEVAMKLIE